MKVCNYQLFEQIGVTAGGPVYLAREVTTGTTALLKLPAHENAADGLRQEYALLQSLDVPEIVKPLALIEDGARPALVLEPFTGEGLDAVLSRQPPLSLPVVLTLALQAARALAALHAAGIVHGDLRPVNFLLAQADDRVQLKLADLSRATARDGGAFPRTAVGRDWAYVSPEQTGRMNRPVDYRTDFYSLGITLYRMLTGELPFSANDPLEWAHCHIARLPLPACKFAPIPEAVSDIVMKLLAKLPEDRYQSAHGLQADLERCLLQWQACGCIDSFPLGTEDASDRFHIPRKLYGRDQERAALLAAFDRMAATGQPALVTVSGYSGIGKSALVGELQQPIVAKRGYFIAGKFDQYRRDIPYATLTQALHDLVQQLLAESEERVAAWRQQIQVAVGVSGQLIVDVLPQVALIIGPQAPVAALPPVEAQHRFRLVFQRFLAVFSSPEHPLTLFLDDMQWADAASLQFIEHLLTQPDTRFLLLIAAYRDNEVDAVHPLTAMLEAIRHGGAAGIDIRLAPLSVLDLNQLVADTLHAPSFSCEPLTGVIFERTEGNPFFFTQFLDALYKEGVLRHDPHEHAWQWDLAQIKGRDFADNVADLMAGKLRRLPVETQETLQLAACLGNTFDLRHLALVGGLAEDETGQRLSAAVHEDLIVLANGHGKFLHDRIQQAAYALIAEARRAEVHLHIGRALAARMTADEIDAHLFDVATQFTQGAALLSDPDEKARVAEIHLCAGRKAKSSTAYPSACVYLSAGMALLDEGCWNSQYELTFNLWLERANCEFLSTNFEVAEQLIVELLLRGASKIDKAAAYHLQVEICEVKSENRRAVDNALECLRLFGIEMPAHPSREQVQAEYDKFWQNLGERSIESLIDLPRMTNPEILAAMHMLSALSTPALFTDLNLVHLDLLHRATLTLKHGTTGAATQGYAWLGLYLGPMFHRYEDGYRFGKLALNLVERHGFIAYKAKLHLALGFVVVWTQPIKATIDFFRTAFNAGIESGDLAFACYSCNNTITARLARGDQLDEVWRESEKGLAFARKVKFRDVADMIVSQRRFIQNMRGRTLHFNTFSDPQFDGVVIDQVAFDEAVFEAQLSEERMATMVCWYWILKVQARFISGDYEVAIAAAGKAEALLWSSVPFIHLLDYHYYTALAIAATCEELPLQRRSALRLQLAAHCAQLQEWAENCSATFFDKHALVAAEVARLEGHDLEAMRLYEESIQSARENGFVQNEAIASELAARFYLERGVASPANGYLEQARSCFARWGADGKVRQLDERYPQLRARTMRALDTPAGGETPLDMLSVTKASQAISSRIVLDEVIDTLMRIMLENAGAQTGCLLLARDEALQLAADAHVEQQTVRVQQHPPHTPPGASLPAAILNYVRRSRKPVLLMDAAVPHPFSADPCFAQRNPKSVLCLPILRQSALIGVLYLENNLVTHAFTPDRVAVMELLASQAAISLENAQLYTDVRQENVERKRAEEALREREARIRQLVESNIIGIFFFDLHGGMSDANDALLHMIGYSGDDQLSGKMQWTLLTPENYHAIDEQKVAEMRATGRCTPYEKEYIRKDGSLVPVLIGAALFEGSQENGVAFVLDLTERRQAEAERAARKSAEAANAAKSAFLANMSHELRTPLNGILGYAQILERNPALGERELAGVNVIKKSGEHLLTLINDILDLAKIEAGKMALDPVDITLARFVQTIADIVGVNAAKKGLELVCDLAPGLPQGIHFDEKRLRQVLLNLLSNAIKFTDHGQVTLRVRFAPPQRLGFEVQDSGIGIAADQLKAIFEPFEQVGDLHRRVAGTGLGLTISRQYVRLMGGEIQVQSRPGQGSTFRFEVEAPPVQAATVILSATTVTGYAGPRKKVLVVDDIAENRAVVTDLLTPLGFEMIEAATGREGLEAARRLRPDLILMDIAMPELDGLGAARLLRQWEAFREVPIVAMSASVSASDSEQCMAAGMNAFLPKPLDADKLLDQMARLLHLQWTYRAAQTPAEAGVMVTPPAEEMDVLYRLARLGNMQEIMAQADRLTTLDDRYSPFADRLMSLAKGYQSKAVLRLVEAHRQGNFVAHR